MYFEYWLVLFSAWCFANIVGLIISDSFKTAVTIYILIPFLVIPQLILSGIIVKFEELNPSVSTPGKIPFYGEIIAARWAYEALAVYQFRNNPFEREFYPYNKAMSRAEYVNNFWIRNLKTRLAYNRRNLNNPGYKEQVEKNFKLLVNELKGEYMTNPHIDPGIDFDNRQIVLNENFIDRAEDYLERLNRHYILLYNNANLEKDMIISGYYKTAGGRERFIEKRDKYHNEALSDLVRNSREVIRIAEFDGRLYQRSDPVYQDPSGTLIKAHFYASEKRIFGKAFNTLLVNTLVIWVMTIFLFLVLYFRLLRRVLGPLGQSSISISLKGIRMIDS
jgi:ABC transport system ATP-binding/permease protein